MTKTRHETQAGPTTEATPFRVLIVDDNELFAQAIARELKSHEIEVDLAYDAALALALGQQSRYQAILLDHKLPDDDGIRIIPLLMGRQPRCSLIVMTAFGAIESALQAIRYGAEDYVVKETSTRPIIDRVLEIRSRVLLCHSCAGWDENLNDWMIGESSMLSRVREQIDKVATTPDTTVLFTGETGVGKEVAARYLHRVSAGPSSPFVSVDCQTMPTTLVESLLFGHEKGAFTGAHKARKGVLHEAGDGTILLDEIGDIDLSLQGKLLRVLETRRFRRVGSVQEHAISARLVLATNRDLMEMVKQGRFRHDLYERLAVFPIDVPPLRERKEDILPIALHYLKLFGEKIASSARLLSPEARARLIAYNYPGNIRELKNILERATILAESETIELCHLPERMLASRSEFGFTGDARDGQMVGFLPGVDTLDSLEQKMIRRALLQAGGVKAEAARLLGVSRYQLIRRIRKYGLEAGAPEEE